MADPEIRDIPIIRDLVQDVNTFSQIERTLPALEPILEACGMDIDALEQPLEDVEQLEEEIEELATLPDRFNDHFVQYGWICFGNVNVSVIKKAVELADQGNYERAEQYLVGYYDVGTVGQQLNWLKTVYRFLEKEPEVIENNEEIIRRDTQSRYELAQKALADYEAGRYHACVPVVLALADGLAQQVHVDVHGQGGALSAKNANHKAWNSIAGHSKGLEDLKEVIMRGRKKTRQEQISIPYRNGIMHGMDLNYDNELVAAKTWGILFAVGEWASDVGEKRPKSKNQNLNSQEKAPLELLREAYETHRETQEIIKSIEEWSSRDSNIGEEITSTGSSDDFEEGTPEHALVRLFEHWSSENYYEVGKLIRDSNGEAADPGEVREQLEDFNIVSFELAETVDKPAAATITAEITYEWAGQTKTKEKEIPLLNMADDGSAVVRDQEGGQWAVTMLHALL